MTARSFLNYLRFAIGLKLIERVGTNPPEAPVYAEFIKYLEPKDGFEYTLAMRRVFKITPNGRVADDWDSLRIAYDEKHKSKKSKRKRGSDKVTEKTGGWSD